MCRPRLGLKAGALARFGGLRLSKMPGQAASLRPGLAWPKPGLWLEFSKLLFVAPLNEFIDSAQLWLEEWRASSGRPFGPALARLFGLRPKPVHDYCVMCCYADLEGNELCLSHLLFSSILEKHKSEAKKASQDADHLNSLQNIDVGNEEELNAFKLKFNSFFFSGDFQEVVHYLSNIAVENRDLHQVLKSVNSRIKEHKSTDTSGNATHRQKCSLVYNLRLQQSPLSVNEILAMNPLDLAAPPRSLRNPCVIWHKRDLHFGPPLHTVLANTCCCSHSSNYVCAEAAGFYICSPDESALFLDHVPSKEDSNILKMVANFVVLHGFLRPPDGTDLGHDGRPNDGRRRVTEGDGLPVLSVNVTARAARNLAIIH
ncbi:hypothetical protein C8F04DRAFT_1183310 [Mycena alexandri]|uniref:Uncharacterized protein n=1 Tax=Mycena alexandri TaxID=1745969 RepID=A0AAD6X481_9AGAR|nr:hypothetical protein C8F04DRAFT_1183310 [Mycena alexandri]